MKFLLLFALLLSCGKKTVYTNPVMPENQASTSVIEEIDEELVLLEKDFKDLGVDLDLMRMPVIVSPLPYGVVGRCQYGKNNQGVFIILSPSLFPMEGFRPMDSVLFEKDFVKVLIHEIGHCYFNRAHNEPEYFEIPGSSFELHHEFGNVIFDKIPKSVMPSESTYRMPKSLRHYYLSELAGKIRLNSSAVLGEFADFKVVSNSNTIEPTNEERGDVP